MCIAERQARRHRPRAEHGISLIELIVFIVIVGIASRAGVVGRAEHATRAKRRTHDPETGAGDRRGACSRKCSSSPSPYCDPTTKPNAANALESRPLHWRPGGVNDETTTAAGSGSRGNAHERNQPYDNVNDYNGFSA